MPLTGPLQRYLKPMALTIPRAMPGSRRRFPQWDALDPPIRFLAAALLGLVSMIGLVTLCFAGTEPEGVAAAIVVYVAGTAIATIAMHRSYPHTALGACNVATLSRFMLAATLVAPLFASADNHWPVLALALVALMLDGVDGWLARREGLVSSFGARFDMEVDAGLAFLLAANALAAGHAGLLVIVLGLPRYLFVIAGILFPWLRRPLPERYGRKVTCVLQLAALIALQVPALAEAASGPLVAAAAVALLWSFGRDVVWLWRARG